MVCILKIVFVNAMNKLKLNNGDWLEEVIFDERNCYKMTYSDGKTITILAGNKTIQEMAKDINNLKIEKGIKTIFEK